MDPYYLNMKTNRKIKGPPLAVHLSGVLFGTPPPGGPLLLGQLGAGLQCLYSSSLPVMFFRFGLGQFFIWVASWNLCLGEASRNYFALPASRTRLLSVASRSCLFHVGVSYIWFGKPPHTARAMERKCAPITSNPDLSPELFQLLPGPTKIEKYVMEQLI